MPTGTASLDGADGKIIAGKYRVVRRLGQGGMGEVYEAEHISIGTRVAIKVLRPEYALNDNVVRRFKQEARSAAKIGHPNIVGVIDLDRELDGSLYMVQELLTGVDLADYIAEHGRLPAHLAVRLCLPVLSALSAAHARGILHRDLKPANIFLARSEGGTVVPKVIDFGIAKVMSGTDAGQTTDGVMMGTLAYMSPEQMFGDATLDGRTDVWAMGVVLYLLIGGACPFEPPAELNIGAVASFAVRVQQVPAPRIETLAPDIDHDLAAFIHQALAPNRDERFPTMQAMYDALSACDVARDALAPVFGGAGGDPRTIIDVAVRPPRVEHWSSSDPGATGSVLPLELMSTAIASAASSSAASSRAAIAGAASSGAASSTSISAGSDPASSGRRGALHATPASLLAVGLSILVGGVVAVARWGRTEGHAPASLVRTLPGETAPSAPIVVPLPALAAPSLTAGRPDAGAGAQAPRRHHAAPAAPTEKPAPAKNLGSNGMPILGD